MLRRATLMHAAHRQRRSLARLDAAALGGIAITSDKARTAAGRPTKDIPQSWQKQAFATVPPPPEKQMAKKYVSTPENLEKRGAVPDI